MGKIKLLFLINSLNGGGAEKALVTLVNSLSQDKFEVNVVSILSGGAYERDLNKNVKYRSIINAKTPLIRKFLAKLICFLLPSKWVYKKLVNKRQEYDYDIAFLEGVPTKIIACSTNKKIAWVHTDLSNYYDQEKVFKSRQEALETYKKYDKIVLVSQIAKEGFVKIFEELDTLVVKNNLIDEKLVLQKSKEPLQKEFDSNKINVVSVGRLVSQKGYDRLLRVQKRLIDEGNEFNLYIVGEGDERQALEKQILDYELSGYANLVGFTNNPYPYMANADFYASSSYVEGWSLVLVEAMICGTPVVLTNVGGAGEVFGDSKYGIVTENSEEGIYQGIKQMLLDKDKRDNYKRLSMQRAQDFVMENQLKKLEELFKG